MTIREFAKKYKISNIDLIHTRNIISFATMYKSLPIHIESEDGKASRHDFITDFIELG